MACVIYRKGDTHVIDGIECEKALVPPEDLNMLLNAGWVVNPKQLLEDKKPVEDDELAALQAKAKEVKVKGWNLIKDKETLQAKIEEKLNEE